VRIAINTGGGDAPGLNAVIRAAVLSATSLGWSVWGIRRGYQGLFEENGVIELTPESVRGITHLGGTILGTTNRGNPLSWPVAMADGTIELVDRSDEVIDEFRRRGLDALVAIGGDGSLQIASVLSEKGLPVVGVPKTIDNDLASTQVSFGFHTAVNTATDAIGRLHSTAEAHDRVMVVELMGRTAGWIALYAGLAATSDVILIPEIPYALDKLCAKIEKRYETGTGFAIVVAAEGAFEAGGAPTFQEQRLAGTPGRLGGIAEKLAQQIEEVTGRETRSLVLGHLQRGGEPIAYDRLLALRFGSAAVELVRDSCFGCMVALVPPKVLAVPLKEAIANLKLVPVDGDLVRTARSIGGSFGDE
jgi:phosphofructokinase-like protein